MSDCKRLQSITDATEDFEAVGTQEIGSVTNRIANIIDNNTEKQGRRRRQQQQQQQQQ